MTTPVDDAPTIDWLESDLPVQRSWLVTALAWAVQLIPALILLLYVALYSVNGPEWDQLNSADIFDRWDRGTFTLEFLFRPHNEHRKALPRLVVLALGKLTRFNNPAEMYLQWALLVGAVALLLLAFRRDARLTRSWTRPLLLFAPAAALLLSARSYELMIGEGLLNYLALFFFIAALSILMFRSTRAVPFAAAAGCGVLTSFSLSNGLLVWPIGTLLLLCESGRARWRRVAIWALIGAATIGAYFHGYVDPGNHSSPRFLLQQPAIGLEYFLALTGGCLAPDRFSADAIGAIVLMMEAALGLVLLAEWRRDRLRPPLGAWLVVTAVVTSIMIALHRAGFGVRTALISRYTPFSSLAPIGLYWCCCVRRDRWRLARVMAAAAATLMIVGYLAGSLDGWSAGPGWYSRRSTMGYLVYTARDQPSSILETLYPNPDHARAYSAALERLGLNVFADPHLRAAGLSETKTQPQFIVDGVNGKAPTMTVPIVVGSDDPISVEGWAFNGAGDGPAAGVFLTVDGRRDLPAHIGVYRPGMGGDIRLRRRRWSGFVGSFAGFVLSPGEHTLAVKIVSDDRRHAFLSDPFARVIRR